MPGDPYALVLSRIPTLPAFEYQQTLTGHTKLVKALATCANGAFLSSSNDHAIRYWTNLLYRLALPCILNLATPLPQPLPTTTPVAHHPPRAPGISITFTQTLAPDAILYYFLLLNKHKLVINHEDKCYIIH